MKRITIPKVIVAVMAVCIFLSLYCSIIPTEALAESRPKVLMIPREGYSADIELMLDKEVRVMTLMLMRAGFRVDVATASGVHIISPGQDLIPDLKLVDVKVDDYAGFIMPCMAVGGIPGPPVAPEAVAIVKAAVAQDKPVAAQFGSIVIMAEAGVLKGKKYSFSMDPLKPNPFWKKDIRFVGAIYSGRDVVQDGNIITSGICPFIEKRWGRKDGTAVLTQALIDELKKK